MIESSTQPRLRGTDGIPTEDMKLPGWRQSFLLAVSWVAGVRLFLTAYLGLLAVLMPQPQLRDFYSYAGVEYLDSGWERVFLNVWQREDALWYQKIATAGYSSADMTVQFFPLYPLAVRLISTVSGLHPVAAGILTSELSLVLGLCLLHRLILPIVGARTSRRTIIYLSLFPSAFFLHAPFSESLVLALVISCFFLVTKGRWLEAAFICVLVGLSRPQGIAAGLPLAVQYLWGFRRLQEWRLIRFDRRSLLVSSVLVAAPVFGTVGFLSLVDTPWRTAGSSSALGPMGFQSLTVPLTPLLYAGSRILEGVAFPIDVFDSSLAVLFLALAALSVVRLPAGLAAYAVLFVLLPLSRYSEVFPLMSFSRYMLLVFPCMVLLAEIGRNRLVHLSIIILSQAFLVVWVTYFYLGGFVA